MEKDVGVLRNQKTNIMKRLLQIESIVPFLLSLILINQLSLTFHWWVWILIFLLPDFSMLGYAFNNKTGALVYNLFHHQLTAVLVWFAGFLLQDEVLQLSGLVLLGHSSLDRVMGFGLKTKAGFKFTHLNTQGN